MFRVIIDFREAFLTGLVTTLQLALVTWLGGLLIGSSLGFLGTKYHRAVGCGIRIVSFILSGVPVLVLLFWLHYPVQALLGVVIHPFFTAALVLTIVNILAVEQIVRGAIQAFPRQFSEAGLVCGLKPATITLRIELPLIARQVISPLLVSQVVALHTTLFASLISVDELLRMAHRVNAQVYKPVEIYSALGLFFLIISLPINGVAIVLKRYYGRDLSER